MRHPTIFCQRAWLCVPYVYWGMLLFFRSQPAARMRRISYQLYEMLQYCDLPWPTMVWMSDPYSACMNIIRPT